MLVALVFGAESAWNVARALPPFVVVVRFGRLAGARKGVFELLRYRVGQNRRKIAVVLHRGSS